MGGDTYCWLIERVWAPAPGTVHTAQYRAAEWVLPQFTRDLPLHGRTTPDAWLARRFKTKADAEVSIAQLVPPPDGYEWRATDHLFHHLTRVSDR
jgi:hypothetical protein